MAYYVVGVAALMTLLVASCDAEAKQKQESQAPVPNNLFDRLGTYQALAESNELNCTSFGRCCEGEDDSCGPRLGSEIYCYCDVVCPLYKDCCQDYVETCRECKAPYINVRGKCLRYAGKHSYWYARNACEEEEATILSPTTEEAWNNFINSDFFKEKVGNKQHYKFWLNCKVVDGEWYWQTGKRHRKGLLVTWNNFDSKFDEFAKLAGLIGEGISAGKWGVAKQWESKHTFCEK